MSGMQPAFTAASDAFAFPPAYGLYRYDPHAEQFSGVGEMRKKLLALAIGILGLGAGLFFTAAHPPFYASQVTVSVTPGGEWDPASLAIMMTSGPVLAAAANQLHPNQTALAMLGDLRVTQVSRLFSRARPCGS